MFWEVSAHKQYQLANKVPFWIKYMNSMIKMTSLKLDVMQPQTLKAQFGHKNGKYKVSKTM